MEKNWYQSFFLSMFCKFIDLYNMGLSEPLEVFCKPKFCHICKFMDLYM